MNIRKIWNIKQSEVNQDLIQACGCNRILAVLLQNRGIDTPEKVQKFLNPLKSALSSPDVFADMQKASDRIVSAIETQEHITVYGDFDADGITSTALLYLTLKEIGANVDYYLPDRAIESHGLNTKALVNIIAKRKTRLIITVDCGISNVAEVNFAKGFKADVIITDHHEAPENIPDAFAIINPKVPNSLSSDLSLEELQSLNYLAGVGVAFKLACKLLDRYDKQNFVHEILPLAAVGTIGDVVELLGENRSIVEMGLELLRNGKHKGLQKLLKEAGITDVSSLTSENVAFMLVPRINASGRLESPDTAISILVSDDEDVLDSAVKTLNDLNALRQELCEETFNKAKEMYEENLSSHRKSIVLLSDDWHIGIIGIVCSKLVEAYNKPTFLMTRDANNSNIIRCSCRSIEGVNVHSVLSEHKDLFEGFGGHKMAAGFSFDETKVSFDKFKSLLNKTVEEYTQDIDFNLVKIDADMVLEPDDITLETIEVINKLQPFGSANPAPLFVLEKANLNSFRFMGQNNNHLKLSVSKNSSISFDCVKWNTPDFNLPLNSELDILFSPSVNVFNGETKVQLMLSDIHSDLLKYDSMNLDIKILDHRNKKNIIMQVLDFISSTKKSTAVYIESQQLKSNLKLPESIEDKIINIDNIHSGIEQLMFFDCPYSNDDFSKIINQSGANTVHLMNFAVSEINIDNFLSKLSGMIKYSLSNLGGNFAIKRASSALNIDFETLECALSLFENCSMVALSKNSDEEYKILSINPVELSKIKQDELFAELSERIEKINTFRNFYVNSSVDEIKESLLV